MATVIPTTEFLLGNKQAMKFVWSLTTADSNGGPIHPTFTEYSDRTIYFLGTWGGATAAWQGGDNATWLPLTDLQGTAISKTADGISVSVPVPEFSRPNLTAVGAGAAITVTCIARKPFNKT